MMEDVEFLQAMELVGRLRSERDALAESHGALIKALRGLLPMNEEGNCTLCAEGIERDADMEHWDTGYIDNRCLDHHMFSQARTVLDGAQKLEAEA